MGLMFRGFYFILLVCLTAGQVSAQGIITTIAGNGHTEYIGDGHPATNFALGGPAGLCLDRHNNLYIANLYTSRVSKLAHDTLSTVVDTSGNSGYSGDGGLADSATVTNPIGVCMDTAGNLYVTDVYYDVIRMVNTEGFISTICGSGMGGYGGDNGPGVSAQLNKPHGAFPDSKGNLYIADYENHRIRRLNLATGIISTFAGTGTSGPATDNVQATASQISYPSSVCTDRYDNVYFAEHGNHRIRKVDAVTGIITTVAGNGSQDYLGDGNVAVQAALNQPNGVYVDNYGFIYISDYGNNVVRAVSPQGIIATIAGVFDSSGWSGDGGAAIQATFQGPTAVCVDNAGNIYIADGDNSLIRRVTPIKFPNAGIGQTGMPSLRIYPNPAANGRFTVCLPGSLQVASVTVTNAIGRCVYAGQINGSIGTIDISREGPGMYYLQTVTPGGSFLSKIVVE